MKIWKHRQRTYKINLNSCRSEYFTHNCAQIYQSNLKLALKYVLPDTSINLGKLCTLQRPLTSIIVSRLGYNRHMPSAVVYGTITFGGLGLLELATEQGCLQSTSVLSHLRADTPFTKMLLIGFLRISS
jgi:hypothetical protein